MPDIHDTDGFDPDSDDEIDDSGVLEDILRGDQGSDRPGGDLDLGSGLTDLERQLADEQNRRAERDLALNRFERFARDGTLGGGGGGRGSDHDALAVIEAAGRFGELEEDDSVREERERIEAALAQNALKPARSLDEYQFYAVITKQGTTQNGNISLTMTVPWEFHEEVFRALDTMPFRAMLTMREVDPVNE